MSSEGPRPCYSQGDTDDRDNAADTPYNCACFQQHQASSFKTKVPAVPPTAFTEQLPTEASFWAWFNKYLATIFGIAVLGGQITFTLIVSDIADPVTLFDDREPAFSKEEVRLLIAISWLFFTSALAGAAFVGVLFNGSSARNSWEYRIRNFQKLFGTVLTFLLNSFLLGAFLMLCLATAAYVPIVGWLGIGLIGVFGLAVFCFWSIGWRTCECC